METIQNENRFFTGLMIGGLLGSVVGMMMAPHSGQKTREMIGEKARGLSSHTREAAEGVYGKARAETRETLSKLRHMISDRRLTDAFDEPEREELQEVLDEAVLRIDDFDKNFRE